MRDNLRSACIESLESRRLFTGVIALFYNTSYVDTTSATPTATAANLQAELVQLGYTVRTFTAIDATGLQQALSGASAVVIPALQNGDLDSSMTNSAKDVLRGFISNGGGLILSGDPQDRDTNFISDTFNISSLPNENGLGSTGGPQYNLSATAAVSTLFAAGPATIGKNPDFRNINTSSLPSGSRAVYTGGEFDTNATAVAMLPYAGKLPIVYLSWDWNNGGPNGALDGGWNTVLNEAVQQLTEPPPSVTQLSGSPSLSPQGSPVTFTASVSASIGTTVPTGTVSFFFGGSTLGTAQLQANGTATFTTSSLPIGADSLTASYSGDAENAPSISSPFVETVSVPLATTTTTLSGSVASAKSGTLITFTATVTGGVAPTGTVSFLLGGALIGSATLQTNGSAVFSTSRLPAATNLITASYSGDANNTASVSAPFVETVVSGQAASSIALATSSASAAFGTPITFTADVSSTISGFASPTGSVTLLSGTTSLGVQTVQPSGLAVFSISSLPAGNDSITASYGGDSNYLGALSSVLIETISPPTTATAVSVTTLAASVSSVAAGQPVTFTATVASSPPGGAVPTGTVNFDVDGQFVQAAPIGSDGTAQFTTSSLPAGTHGVTATYTGDATYPGSTSPSVSETVTVSSIPNPPVSGPSLAATLGNVDLPASVMNGAKLSAKWPVIVTNTGASLNGRIVLNIFLSTGTTLDGTQTFLATLNKPMSLPGNSSITEIVPINSLLRGLAPGAYHVLTAVTEPSNTQAVSASSQTIQVAAPFVALSATAGAVAPSAIAVGKSGSLIVTVTNNGNEQAAGNLDIQLGCSSDGVSPVSGITLSKIVKKVKIKAGGVAKYKVSFKRSASLAAGAYFPYVTVSLGGVSAVAIGSVSFTAA